MNTSVVNVCRLSKTKEHPLHPFRSSQWYMIFFILLYSNHPYRGRFYPLFEVYIMHLFITSWPCNLFSFVYFPNFFRVTMKGNTNPDLMYGLDFVLIHMDCSTVLVLMFAHKVSSCTSYFGCKSSFISLPTVLSPKNDQHQFSSNNMNT